MTVDLHLTLARIPPSAKGRKTHWSFGGQLSPIPRYTTSYDWALLLNKYTSLSQSTAAERIIDGMVKIYGLHAPATRNGTSAPAFEAHLDETQTLAILEVLHESELISHGRYENAVGAVTPTVPKPQAFVGSKKPVTGCILADNDDDEPCWRIISGKPVSVDTLGYLPLVNGSCGVLVPVSHPAKSSYPSPTPTPPLMDGLEPAQERVFVNVTFESGGYGTDVCDS